MPGFFAMQMRFNNFIFDLDGTLVDSFRDIYSALNAATRDLGLSVPSEERIRDNMHLRLDQLIDLLYPDRDLNRIMDRFREYYDGSGYRSTRLYPGVEETLEHLHDSKCHLFVTTNKRKIAADAILSRLKIDTFFDTVLSSDIAHPPLGKDDLVRMILIDGSLDPSVTVMIGDAQGDADAALNNCISFIYAAYGYGKLNEKRQMQPTIVSVKSFRDLMKYGP